MLLVPSYEEFRISSEGTLENPVFRRVVLDRGDHRLRWFVYFSGDPPYLRHGSFGSVFLPAELLPEYAIHLAQYECARV